MAKQLNEQIVELIISMHKENKSIRYISSTLKIPYSTIRSNIVKVKKTGSCKRLIGSGRNEKIPLVLKEIIKDIIKKDPFKNSTEILNILKEKYEVNFCERTIRNYFKILGYKNKIGCKKPLLSKKNIKNRLLFANEHIIKEVDFWDNVIFSDEVKINFFGNDSKQKVWRKPNERYLQKNIIPSIKYGGGSLMCWGCISTSGVGELFFIDGIMDRFKYLEILQVQLKKSIEKMHLNTFIFQHDNDPKHTSGLIKDFFIDNKIEVLQWPSQSPDLNPIENVWAYIKSRITKRKKSKEELKQEILTIWNSITPAFCKKLILNMPKRLISVIKAKGKNTKY